MPLAIQPATGAADLPGQFLDGKDRAKYGLLAIEVELIGVGEVAVDPVAQTGPARRIRVSGETLHHLPFPDDSLVRAKWPTGGVSGHPGEKLQEQLRADSIGFFRVGAGELVCVGVYLGDPDAMRVTPGALLADDWIAARRASIDEEHAHRGVPVAGPDGGTIYMCTADSDGLLVSLIQSNFTAAGSGLRVDDWGLNLHNRGSSFTFDGQHPNALGPRKMPLHTLIPAMAMRDDRPWLVFGTEGGHGQAQTHTQLLVRMLVDGDDPQQAISAPRFTVDPGTGRVAIEDLFDTEWIAELRRRGHEVDVVKGYRHGPGIAHMIECLTPGYRAASDPRAEGGTAGH